MLNMPTSFIFLIHTKDRVTKDWDDRRTDHSEPHRQKACGMGCILPSFWARTEPPGRIPAAGGERRAGQGWGEVTHQDKVAGRPWEGVAHAIHWGQEEDIYLPPLLS